MNARFYNAGDRINETFRFSHPEGIDIHAVGFWKFDAPKQGWFEVPSEVELQNTTVAVQFVRDIKQKFGPRGIVLLDPRWDPATEDPDGELWKYPLAPSEAQVIERADKLWLLYLRKMVESHLADCQSAMAAGGAPRAASGFTKRALALLGIQDPGEQYFLNLRKGATNGNGATGISEETRTILAHQGTMMQTMLTLVLAQASGEKLDAETIKKLIAPVQTPDTLTSGVMTGKVAKPVDATLRGVGPDADVFDRKVKPKSERNKAAVAAL